MAEDDDAWIQGIHVEHQAAREQREAEERARFESRATFDARADEFWQMVTGEMARVVAAYNEGAEERMRVTMRDDGRGQLAVTWAGRASIALHFNRPAQEIQIVDAIDRGTRSSSGRRVRQLPSGDLEIVGGTVADFVREVLEPFLRGIG